MKKFLEKIFFNNYNLELDMAYGRISYLSNISFLGGKFDCRGEGNFMDDYPRLSFVCNLQIFRSAKIFLKPFL